MTKYGQYCPIAQALEVLGDRWTLLIIRDMLAGATHFNDIQRGLPGISRALLAKRLKQLREAGIIEKQFTNYGRMTTEYSLTQAGKELQEVISSLLSWSVRWAFGDPSPEQLDPLLLMWWMRNNVNEDGLPDHRVVVQFNFRSDRAWTYWLVLVPEGVELCLTDPGFDVDVLVTAGLATFFKLWMGRISYSEALSNYGVEVEGIPHLARSFPQWFKWSSAAAVRAVQAGGTSIHKRV